MVVKEGRKVGTVHTEGWKVGTVKSTLSADSVFFKTGELGIWEVCED